MIDFCFSCLTIINIMDNNVSTESNCIIEATGPVCWSSGSREASHQSL